MSRLFHGDLIIQILFHYGWTQKDLAEVLGRPTQLVNEIINDKKEITRETAMQLEAATGIEAGYLLGVQDRWRMSKIMKDPATQRKLSEITTRASSLLRKR